MPALHNPSRALTELRFPGVLLLALQGFEVKTFLLATEVARWLRFGGAA